MSASRQVQLPEDLCTAAEKKFAARFHSVEELLEFVLRDLVQDFAAAADENEQRIVEERLKELGYL